MKCYLLFKKLIPAGSCSYWVVTILSDIDFLQQDLFLPVTTKDGYLITSIESIALTTYTLSFHSLRRSMARLRNWLRLQGNEHILVDRLPWRERPMPLLRMRTHRNQRLRQSIGRN